MGGGRTAAEAGAGVEKLRGIKRSGGTKVRAPHWLNSLNSRHKNVY